MLHLCSRRYPWFDVTERAGSMEPHEPPLDPPLMILEILEFIKYDQDTVQKLRVV